MLARQNEQILQVLWQKSYFKLKWKSLLLVPGCGPVWAWIRLLHSLMSGRRRPQPATIGSCPHLCVKHKKCSLTKHLRSGRHIYLNQENTLLWRVWSQQQNLRYSSLNLLFFRFKAITEYWNKCVVRPKFWSKSPKSYPSLKLWIELLILILDIKYNRYELFQFCHCAASQNVPVVEFSNVVAVNVKDSE